MTATDHYSPPDRPRIAHGPGIETWAIFGNLRTRGMAAEDGPRLNGSCVLLGSMIRAPRRRCSRKLHAPGTARLGQANRRVRRVIGTRRSARMGESRAALLDLFEQGAGVALI